MIAVLHDAVAKATKLRQEEHATSTQTIKDSQETQTAVAKALVILKALCAQAAEATVLLHPPRVAPFTAQRLIAQHE